MCNCAHVIKEQEDSSSDSWILVMTEEITFYSWFWHVSRLLGTDIFHIYLWETQQEIVEVISNTTNALIMFWKLKFL